MKKHGMINDMRVKMIGICCTATLVVTSPVFVRRIPVKTPDTEMTGEENMT